MFVMNMITSNKLYNQIFRIICPSLNSDENFRLKTPDGAAFPESGDMLTPLLIAVDWLQPEVYSKMS